ncbi:MAG TPA: polysaccharide deacetylase family protein [Candidatus Saccharimonadales bacterium]|nr:polysaccharide deacetylase family protein [Candidatus Saccharimonadales bacterium]
MDRIKFFIAVLLISSFWAVIPAKSQAITQANSPQAKISFAFDDGYASTYTQAATILAKYGFTGTEYATTGCMGMTKVPNKCAANKKAAYMSWAQLTQLQNTYGWEIGSHTVNHPYLSEVNATRLNNELSQSKSALASHGINAVDFATPYGDYNTAVLAATAKYYESQRGYADTGYNVWPYSDYYLKVQQVKGSVPVATAKSYIDTAITGKTWLILVFHDIKDKVSTKASEDGYSISGLDQIAAYVKSKQVSVVHIDQGLVRGDVNLLANGSFNDGLANGWITNSSTTITFDTLNNGSYPDSANSIKMVSASANRHLFSPLVAVNPSQSYVIKNYLYVAQNTSGGIGFYIDEYDSSGNWISGQYKVTEPSVFAESLNFSYTPSSAAVAKAGLQVIVLPGGTVAYLDNVQWLAL